jgi:hypothetical protein
MRLILAGEWGKSSRSIIINPYQATPLGVDFWIASFNLSNDNQITETQLDWIPTDDRCRNAWANLDDATRDGAYALALAAIAAVVGFREKVIIIQTVEDTL